MHVEGARRQADEGRLPEMLLALLILAVSPLGTLVLEEDFTYLGLTALMLALPFMYVAIVTKVNEQPDISEKKRLFRIYVSFFIVLMIIIMAEELYGTNWPSTIGNIVYRITSRAYLAFAAIQSVCILVVNLLLKRQAADPRDRRLRLRLWMSVLMVLVSPLNLLLYGLLFFHGT